MNREEKINSLIEFINDNNIKIIDNELIEKIIIDSELVLDIDEHTRNKLLDKGFTEDDVVNFKKFLEANDLILVKYDYVSGLSFEAYEYSTDILHESDLWEDGDIEYNDNDARW